MLILRFALLTCVFYLGMAAILEGAFFVFAYVRGGAGMFGTRLGWTILFGIVWLISFNLTYHIVTTRTQASIERVLKNRGNVR